MPHRLTSVALRWMRRAVYVVCGGLVVGCKPADSGDAAREGARASMIELARVPLGSSVVTSVTEVTYAAYDHERLAVIDRVARRTHVYDRRGNLLWRVGEGDGPPRPNGLAWKADTLLLVDVSPASGVWVLDRTGRHVRTARISVSGTPTGVAAVDGRLFVATTGLDEAILADTAAVVYAMAESSGTVRAGCPVHNVYRSSLRTSGMASIFRANGVLARPSGVLCWQPLAPFAWWLGADMRPTDSINLQEFVPAPRHMRVSMDLISINKFREDIGEIIGVFTGPRFTHVVVASFDSVAGNDRYVVARCLHAGTHACQGYRSSVRPIGMVTDDTLMAIAPRRTGDTLVHVSQLVYPPSP